LNLPIFTNFSTLVQPATGVLEKLSATGGDQTLSPRSTLTYRPIFHSLKNTGSCILLTYQKKVRAWSHTLKSMP